MRKTYRIGSLYGKGSTELPPLPTKASNPMLRTFKIIALSSFVSIGVIGLVLYLSSSEPKRNWVVISGHDGGKYHEVAKALRETLTDKEDLEIEVRTSLGSHQNLAELANGRADLALVQNDISSDQEAHCLAILYEEALHLIVREEVKSPRQLNGSVIAMGSREGGTEGMAMATLAHLGIRAGKFSWDPLDESLTKLANGELDCVCVVTGVGNATIGKHLAKGKLTLLPIGSNPYENLKLTYPFIQPAIIPSGAYPSDSDDRLPRETVSTIGTRVVLVCSPNLEEEDAYAMSGLIDSAKASLTKAHPLFAQLSDPTETLLQHPLHPGARLFYERTKPNFFQEWADTIALVFSLIAVAWWAAKAMGQIYLRRLKDSLDTFFAKVEAITSELIEGVDGERANEIAKELHEIRRETTQKLIAEELGADDSFVIFQRQLHTAQQLVNESLRKSPKS